jgi:hypothetical protein
MTGAAAADTERIPVAGKTHEPTHLRVRGANAA